MVQLSTGIHAESALAMLQTGKTLNNLAFPQTWGEKIILSTHDL